MSANQFLAQFWRYSIWSLEFLSLPQFLAILLFAALSLAFAVWHQRPFKSPLWKQSHWFVLTQLLFFPVVISIAVLYPPAPTPNSIANNVCDFLGWISLVLAGFWVYRMRGFRWFAVSLVAMLEVILLGAFFVAGMAVTGKWL